jgi:hypothetical protein
MDRCAPAGVISWGDDRTPYRRGEGRMKRQSYPPRLSARRGRAASAPAQTDNPAETAALQALYRKVAALRQAVLRDGARTLALWDGTVGQSEFRAVAENLAHYLALRRHDLSALQPALAAYGLSSLGGGGCRLRPPAGRRRHVVRPHQLRP